jgi:hypothetical protein
LERLFLKDEALTIGAKLASAQVEFEFAKADDLSGIGWIRHRASLRGREKRPGKCSTD